MDKRTCYASYQPEGQCLQCTLALLCIQATIAADGYYDELARREEEKQWELISVQDDVISAWLQQLMT